MITIALKLVTPPAREPVSLALAKSHLRGIDHADDDNIIQGLIISARRNAEGFQNRAYLEQTWDMWLDAWLGKDCIDIKLPPLQSITSIKYYDTSDVEYTLATTEYDVDTYSEPGRVVLKSGKTWPSTTLRPSNGIVIRFVAGYATYSSTVSTSGTSVTKTAGDDFVTSWQEGKTVTINGVTYRIASVASTTGLILAATAGTQTGVAFQADDVLETVKQAMLLDIELNYDDHPPQYAETLKKRRDSLLWMERVW